MKKVKVKQSKKKIGSNDLSSIFNQLTGATGGNPKIVGEKYKDICEMISSFVTAWEIFLNSKYIDIIRSDISGSIKDIELFVIEGNRLLASRIKPEENKIQTNFKLNSKKECKELTYLYNPEELTKAYAILKESPTFTHILKTLSNIKLLLDEDCNNRNSLIQCLGLKEMLSETFITQAKSSTKLLPFSSIDFKYVYEKYAVDNVEFKKLLLVTLHFSYVSAREMYKTYVKPDIDVDEFVNAFKDKLGEVKVVIQGCDKAFECLDRSMKMFKENFDKYYKDFITTNNPNVIFESFIEDVKNNNKNNPSVMVGFKKIVEFIKQKMPIDQQNKDMVNKLFTVSDQIFKDVPNND